MSVHFMDLRNLMAEVLLSIKSVDFLVEEVEMVESTEYLRADLTISTDHPHFDTAQSVAAFMIASFSIGLPLIYLYLIMSCGVAHVVTFAVCSLAYLHDDA